MKRISFILWLALAVPALAQETISDQPTLPPSSLNTPANVFALVDDTNAVPTTTNKVALDDIAAIGHAYLRPTTPTTLTGAESYLLAVDCQNVANTITVPDQMSCVITNVSDNGSSLVVNTTGNTAQTLLPGQYLWVSWSTVAADHTLGRHPAYDTAMSPSSTNAVQNLTVKAYVDAAIPTVDTTVSTVSTNPVRNSAITNYVDNRAMVRQDDFVITGSGNSTTDATAISTAVTALNAAGTGTLWIEGTVRLNSLHTFTAPISLRGIDHNSGLLITAEAGEFSWGSSWDPIDTVGGTAAQVLLPTAAFDGFIDSPNQDLADGQWFMIWSTDNLTGMPPHVTSQSPMEIHSAFNRESHVWTVYQGTFTADSGTDTLTATGHPLVNGSLVVMSSSGTLPAGMGAGPYYVVNAATNTYQISTTLGGGALDFTDNGTGTHTARTTNQITSTAHKLVNGSKVVMSTTAALPTGISAATPYYVINKTTNTYQISTTPGGAAVIMSDIGTGTQTALTSRYKLGGFVVDAMVTSPQIRVVPLLSQPDSEYNSNVIVSDLNVRQSPGISNDRLFNMRCLNGVKVERVHWEVGAADNSTDNGAGQLLFAYSANIVVDGIQIDALEDYDQSTGTIYGVEFSVVNNAVVSNSTFRKIRHAVDTTSGTYNAGTGRRWGTPLNVLVTNNIFHCEGHTGSSLFATSTHSEGWGVTFANNVYFVGEDNLGGALTARARRTIFRNNVVHGGGLCRGVFLGAAGCEATGNVFYNTWRGVTIDGTYGNFDKCIVDGNQFIDGTGSLGNVHIDGGVDHRITNNLFQNCSQGGVYSERDNITISGNQFIDCTSTTYPAIELASSYNAQITNNHFEGCEGGAVKVSTGDRVHITNNHFFQCPNASSAATINFAGTGTASSGESVVMHNVFNDCNSTCINYAGGATVAMTVYGDDQRIVGNTFEDCSGTDIIQFADDGTTTGHRVARNDLWNGLNTNSIDVGSLDSAAIKIVGNVCDGYGAGSLGLVGTNATTINTNQAGDNWTD